MVQQGGVESQNNFNPQGAIFWVSHTNHSAVWELNVSGASTHREVSVTPDNLVEIEPSRTHKLMK